MKPWQDDNRSAKPGAASGSCRAVIVVLGSGRDADATAVDQAVELVAARGRLVLLHQAQAPTSGRWVSFGGLHVPAPSLADLHAAAMRVVFEAVDRVPRDVPVTTCIATGPLHRALEQQLYAGHHDVVLCGSRPPRRVRRAAVRARVPVFTLAVGGWRQRAARMLGLDAPPASAVPPAPWSPDAAWAQP